MMNSEEAFKKWAADQLRDKGQTYSDLDAALWMYGYTQGAIDTTDKVKDILL